MRRTVGALSSFLLVALIHLPSPAAAQQSAVITGTVTDAESGRPLQAAQVSIIGSDGRGGLTNAQGVYRIEVEPGTYSVAVVLIGYAEERVEGVRVGSGETRTLDIELESRAQVLNPLVVTASRREEKALESPSTIVTIGAERIEERAALSPVEHVKGLPGVDVSQTGLTQSNVVTRGFNNIFSGALLVITDNRYAHVPSLRFNAYNMIPTTSSDIERMEVLLGPAAALYGPNSASGVLHIVTSSPLDDQQSVISVAGGQRDVFQGHFRTAFNTTESSALKVSGQYFQGSDWEFRDPAEVEAREDAIAGGADPDTLRVGARDFDSERWSGELRWDWRPGEDTEVILSTGLNNLASSVELTGVGGGQADDWMYQYAQARFRTGRLFAQAFLNRSDAGDTYLLRTGQPIVDKSELWAAQVQHGFALGESQDFIYGVDLSFTRPKTEGTITGRNEDDDDINEIGGYIQSQTQLADQVQLVAALRLDDHNRLQDLIWSPRAALVFNPAEEQSFRVSYNRAFSTPTTNNLFLDLVAARIPLGGGFRYDVRTLGVPGNGFTFEDECAGGIQDLCMRTPFAPGQALPADGAVLWNGLVQTLGQLRPELAPLVPLLQTDGAPPPIGSRLLRFNQEEGDFLADPTGPEAIQPLSPTIHNTYEIGYKGILGSRLLVAADLYSENIQDFVGPLRVETPNVFYDPQTLQQYVTDRLTAAAQGGLIPPEDVPGLVEEIVTTAAMVPLGTVVPDQVDSPDLLLTYRNFGDVDLWGADLSFQFLATDRLSITGSYAHVSEDCFNFDEDPGCGSAQDVALNAPRNKGSLGVRWADEFRGLTLESRSRFVQGFPMNSGVYIGDVEGYAVVDANVQYRLSRFPGASVTLSAYNVFDDRHREFVGAPDLGRLVLLRLMYQF